MTTSAMREPQVPAETGKVPRLGQAHAVLLGAAGAMGVLALAPWAWPSILVATALTLAGLAALPLATREERRRRQALAACLVNHERFSAELASITATTPLGTRSA